MIIKANALTLLAKYPVASQHLASIVWEPCSDPDLAAEGYLQHTTPLPAWEYGEVDDDLARISHKRCDRYDQIFIQLRF
jgi:hypothetical protein